MRRLGTAKTLTKSLGGDNKERRLETTGSRRGRPTNEGASERQLMRDARTVRRGIMQEQQTRPAPSGA